MKFGTSISSLQPQQESSPTTQNLSIFWMQKDTNFGNAIILCYLGPENRQNPTQKDTNFGNAIILHHLGPENHQNPTQKRHEFQETALIDPSKKCQQIRKVFIFSEFCTIIEMHSLTPSTLTNQSLWEHLVTRFLDCRPIVIYSDSSTLVQDAVLNCYKRPAHYHYQFSYFSEDQSHLV